MITMKKAIQFGAGNIGRGFIGAVLAENGYHVVFADVNETVVGKINEDKEYVVRIMDTECTEIKITNISAVDSRSPQLVQEIARRGHEIGNHSDSHAHFTQISDSQIR